MLTKQQMREYEKRGKQNLEGALSRANEIVLKAQGEAHVVRLQAWEDYLRLIQSCRGDRDTPKFLLYRESDARARIRWWEKKSPPLRSIFPAVIGPGSDVEASIISVMEEAQRPMTVRAVYQKIGDRYGWGKIRDSLRSLTEQRILHAEKSRGNALVYSLIYNVRQPSDT